MGKCFSKVTRKVEKHDVRGRSYNTLLTFSLLIFSILIPNEEEKLP